MRILSTAIFLLAVQSPGRRRHPAHRQQLGAHQRPEIVTWDVIGSTATSNAATRIGNSNLSGVRVFLVNGTLVNMGTVASPASFWGRHSVGISVTELGTTVAGPVSDANDDVWTGTIASGSTANSSANGYPLGSTLSQVGNGNATSSSIGVTNESWASGNANGAANTVQKRLYGISQVFTVGTSAPLAPTPEPSFYAMVSLGLAGLFYARRRR